LPLLALPPTPLLVWPPPLTLELGEASSLLREASRNCRCGNIGGKHDVITHGEGLYRAYF